MKILQQPSQAIIWPINQIFLHMSEIVQYHYDTKWVDLIWSITVEIHSVFFSRKLLKSKRSFAEHRTKTLKTHFLFLSHISYSSSLIFFGYLFINKMFVQRYLSFLSFDSIDGQVPENSRKKTIFFLFQRCFSLNNCEWMDERTRKIFSYSFFNLTRGRSLPLQANFLVE